MKSSDPRPGRALPASDGEPSGVGVPGCPGPLRAGGAAPSGPGLSVRIGSLTLPTPLVIASGVWSAERPLPEGIGGAVGKGVTLRPRAGNPGRRLHETPSGLLNSIGLQNPGVDVWIRDSLPLLAASGVPVMANVAFEGFGELEAVLDRLSYAEGLAGVELNISCPNVAEGGMAFGCLPAPAAEATALARRTWGGPLWVKLTPQAPDPVAVARAVEAAGADALVAANTWTGAAVDPETGRPVFRRVTAGLSGPAIFPLALWLLMRIAPAVSIPVLGCGGVFRGEDVLAMLYAGARAVELGTVLFADESAPLGMIETVSKHMRSKGYGSLEDLRRPDR